MKHAVKKMLAALGPLGRLLGWWLALTGLVVGSAVCPHCGQVGCPLGAGTASFIGLVGALALAPFRRLLGHWSGDEAPACCDHNHDHGHNHSHGHDH